MSHGFTRFGQPAARDRLHARMRGPGTLSMLLPTIVATLFMFTVVVTLNRATSLTRGGNIVRLMNVDDVFATPQAVEQNRKKEYWELMVPPPSPEAVMAEDDLANLQRWNANSEGRLDGDSFLPSGPPRPEADIAPLAPTSIPGFAPTPASAPRTAAPTRRHTIPTPEIQLPAVAPDTSLPVATPTP